MKKNNTLARSEKHKELLAALGASITRARLVTGPALAASLARNEHTVRSWTSGRGRPDEKAVKGTRHWLESVAHATGLPTDSTALMGRAREEIRRAKTCTLRTIAAQCGVHERSVRRWISGVDVVRPSAVPVIRRWLKSYES